MTTTTIDRRGVTLETARSDQARAFATEFADKQLKPDPLAALT